MDDFATTRVVAASSFRIHERMKIRQESDRTHYRRLRSANKTG